MMRIGRCLWGALIGWIGGVFAFVAAFEVQDAQGPIQFRVGAVHGLTLLVNVIWLAAVPSLVAGCIAGLIASLPKVPFLRIAFSAAIGGVVGCAVSVLIWRTVQGDFQGPNPILFAGFGVGSLTAATVAVVRPHRGGES